MGYAYRRFSDPLTFDSYTQDIGWTVQGGDSPSAFQSSGDYDVTQFDLALGHLSGSNAAVVSLWANDLGALGPQLGSWGVSGQPTFGGLGSVLRRQRRAELAAYRDPRTQGLLNRAAGRATFRRARRPAVARAPPPSAVSGMRWRRRALGSTMPVEESEDRLVEGVVAITGDHVVGAGDVDELGVGRELQEVLHPLR